MKIGFSEIIIIFVVALIVIGPDKLPAYARKLGEALREFRNVSNDLTKDLKETVIEPLEEAQKPIKEALQPMTEVTDDIKKNIDDVKKSVNDIGKPSAKKHDTAETGTVVKTADVSDAAETTDSVDKTGLDDSVKDSTINDESPKQESEEADKASTDSKFETVGHYRV